MLRFGRAEIRNVDYISLPTHGCVLLCLLVRSDPEAYWEGSLVPFCWPLCDVDGMLHSLWATSDVGGLGPSGLYIRRSC
jgi:hypothetical protein